MAINKYVGSRYVPLYCGVHDKTKAYEPLSIVSNAERNETFTSAQSVPVGVELTNAEYWLQSGYTNAGMVIETDSAPVVSTNESELVAERTTDGYMLTLSVANAFDCDGDVGEGLTLNTMYDVGRWQFEPSKCAGVPDEIKELTTPAELVITDYTVLGSNIMRQRQQIVAYDDDNAALFVRTHDGKNWSDWKMIGFNGGGGGTYVLPVATANVLGGVKIGSGVNVTSDGTISVDDSVYTLPVASASTLGGVKVGDGLSAAGDGTLSVTGVSSDGWEAISKDSYVASVGIVDSAYISKSKQFILVNARLTRQNLDTTEGFKSNQNMLTVRFDNIKTIGYGHQYNDYANIINASSGYALNAIVNVTASVNTLMVNCAYITVNEQTAGYVAASFIIPIEGLAS